MFYCFWEWVRCLILQINTSFLISQQKTYIFAQETLHIFLFFKDNTRFPSEGYLRPSWTQLNPEDSVSKVSSVKILHMEVGFYL